MFILTFTPPLKPPPRATAAPSNSPTNPPTEVHTSSKTSSSQSHKGRPYRCSRCGQAGHNVRRCPTPHVWFRQRCGQCGGTGHNARNCPNTTTCRVCNGLGKLACSKCHGKGFDSAPEQSAPLSDAQRIMADRIRQRVRHVVGTVVEEGIGLVGSDQKRCPRCLGTGFLSWNLELCICPPTLSERDLDLHKSLIYRAVRAMSRTTILGRRSSSESPATQPNHDTSPHNVQGVPALAAPRTTSELWMAAIKPPMYTVAITPITVGSAAAWADTKALHASTLLLFLVSAVLIIAWLNISNDVFDYDTGIDVNKRESLVNLLGGTRRSRNALVILAHALLLAAFAALFAISTFPWDPTVLTVIAIAVFGGYAYQGPPFRLGYYGLGEPICFISWLLGVCAAYYSQVRHDVRTVTALSGFGLSERLSFLKTRFLDRGSSLAAAALSVAIPTTVILFCSHFHQIRDDERAGKKSPIVRLGTELAARVLRVSLLAFLALEVALFSSGMLPTYPFLLTLLSIPYALDLEGFVSRTHALPPVVRAAKYYAVKFHFIHGMLLSIGLLLSARNGVASW